MNNDNIRIIENFTYLTVHPVIEGGITDNTFAVVDLTDDGKFGVEDAVIMTRRQDPASGLVYDTFVPVDKLKEAVSGVTQQTGLTEVPAELVTKKFAEDVKQKGNGDIVLGLYVSKDGTNMPPASFALFDDGRFYIALSHKK